MRCLLRQVADGNMDSFHGALGRLDELDLGLAPLVATQQPVRDHVEVAPDRTDLPYHFTQFGKFIFRERDGVLDLLPDQRHDPAGGGLPRRLRNLADAPHFVCVQTQMNLATLATVSAGRFGS